MLNSKTKIVKQVKFIEGKLYLKVNETVIELGEINTRKGKLTRVQKLRAVAALGEWINI